MMRLFLLTLLILTLCGCSKTAEVEDKAIWMCLNSHWSLPKIDHFPDDHAPAMYISASDLAFLKEHGRSDVLGQLFMAAAQVDVIGMGARQALADRSECKVLEVKVDASNTKMTIMMQRLVPDWELDLTVKRYAELASLQSASRVASKIKTLIDAEKPPMLTQTHEMSFIKERDRWVMSFGLKAAHEAELAKEAARARLEQEITRQEGIKKELEHEHEERLEDASVFEQVEIKSVSMKRLPPERQRPDQSTLRFDVFATNSNLCRFSGIAVNAMPHNHNSRFSLAKFTVGLKSKDGATLWEKAVESNSFRGGREQSFSLFVSVDKALVIPDDAQPYVLINELANGDRVYNKANAEAERLLVQSVKEKLAIVDAEIAKLRKQLN